MLKLIHVALHNAINANAGDILLGYATRQCFEHFLGPIDWTLQQAWDPFDASLANQHDGVVVGGGGLLLPDQEGASYEASGWQWNCTLGQLNTIVVPLIVFGVGYNRFRGQEDFSAHFYQHWHCVINKAAFVGMREHGAFGVTVPWVFPDITYQPCPTTCLWQLYPEYRATPSKERWLGINVADDRPQYRYANDEQRISILKAIATVAREAGYEGWNICLLKHKAGDGVIATYLMNEKIPFQAYDLSGATPEAILQVYQHMHLVIGMRSHSQLIPFGLRRGIISVISHDKLQRFLKDMSLGKWGIDVQDTGFSDRLFTQYRQMNRGLDVYDDAQEYCWEVTKKNMQRIAGILQREVVCQE